jgi:hypothetical protein
MSLRDTAVFWVALSRQWNWRAIFGGPSGTRHRRRRFFAIRNSSGISNCL